jgi:hypothetical protein
MRILSDNTVSKSDLDSIDEKQSRQIKQLRVAVGASFALNLVITLVLFLILV